MMNKTLLIALLCAAFFCPAAPAADSTSRPYKPRPTIGMTQAQVLARYGEPYHRATIGKETQWDYHLKFGEVYGREFVPFQYDSDNVFLGVITFDGKGRISSLVWNHTVAR